MDYDQTDMPAVYEAGRAYSSQVLSLWLSVVSRWVPNGASVILDLGCGTGRYSAALADLFNARVIAVDPSAKMLAQARKKSAGRVYYARAAAETLPLPDEFADMIFMSMVFHHFDDREQAVRECRRVLRHDGSVCLRAGTTDRISQTPYLPFFPRSDAILHNTFHSQAALAFRADSILAQLSDQEFEKGLAAARQYATAAPPVEPVNELVDFFVFRSIC